MLPIIGDMAMPKYHDMGIWKFAASGASVAGSIAKNMYDANLAISHGNFAFDRQLRNHLFTLNIALHRHNGRYRLQLSNNPQDRQVARMHNQLDAVEILPDHIG